MGCFVGYLLLTRASSSADMQLTILMRHTDPSFAPILSRKLSSELEKLTKDNASYVFFRTKVTVEPHEQSVLLDGERTLLLGDKVLSKTMERYRLRFSNYGGQLLLSAVEREGESYE
jgi:type IV conjugative transfer system protein TraE